MSPYAALEFAGGIGLILLGMRLMTEGLRVAAGNALRRILAASTDTPVRGVASGMLITALVQSSSAVTFATVGFVNAGLMNVAQAITVIYGANVGTTLTSWLVALVGFNVNLQALALPAIGVGMGLRVTGGSTRRGSVGDALAGFGLFFLGVDILRMAFSDLGAAVDLAAFALPGPASVLGFLTLGVILTVLMQSSSAALALTLTAAAGGLVSLEDAAALVIGANLGTTSTAAFAAIGATPNARRVAAGHVLFNAITAIIALATLPLMLWLAQRLGAMLPAGPAGIAATLAVFHTLTKVTGLLAVWPLTGRLVGFLAGRFRAQEEDLARTRYLDTNVLTTPSLALDAVRLELADTGDMALSLMRDALHDIDTSTDPRRPALEQRLDSLAGYVNRLHETGLPPSLHTALPLALRVGQYQADIAQRAVECERLRRERREGRQTPAVKAVDDWRLRLARTLPLAGVWHAGAHPDTDWADNLLADYAGLKQQLLQEGSQGVLPVRRMVNLLDEISAMRRALEQMRKGAQHYLEMRGLIAGASAPPQPEETDSPVEDRDPPPGPPPANA
ncbi:MAG: Na/Pi cotransporter family protein [Ectothiorhodospiraceae bacterium]|nr:Na/Pi cotransporter family protein [Ectothiorhodospiraceae bacterium]